MLPSFYKSKTIPPLALMDLTKERANGLPNRNLINAERSSITNLPLQHKKLLNESQNCFKIAFLLHLLSALRNLKINTAM